MNQNNMTEASVYELLTRYNIIVPEIQREYVWGGDSKLLNKFFDDILDSCRNNSQKKTDARQRLQKDLSRQDITPEEAIKQFYSSSYMNIGFLYSYRPFYQADTASNKEDLYLIDGQQRFTTLFLMLVVAARKAGKFDDLYSLWSSPDGRSFDYKVRDLTHEFLGRFMEYCKGRYNFEESFSVTTAFHSEDQHDPSISKMLKTIELWNDRLKSTVGITAEMIYEFLLHDVRFWHFKTEKTTQGEELYITMNARGRRLAQNEMIRAEMDMNHEQSKNWEGVKDFFWEHRHERQDEEFGMNEFCTWLELLFPSEVEREANWEKCFEAVRSFCDNGFFGSIDDADNKAFVFPNRFLFSYNSNNPKGKDTLSQNDHFRLIPVIKWYIKFFIENKGTISSYEPNKQIEDIISFFMRLSKDGNISKSIDDTLQQALLLIDHMSESDIASIGSNDFDSKDCNMLMLPEEIFKFKLYLNPPDGRTRDQVETIINDLQTRAEGRSLLSYFRFAGNNEFNWPPVDGFMDNLDNLKNKLDILASFMQQEGKCSFYGAFIPELYNEKKIPYDNSIRLEKNDCWATDDDMLTFLKSHDNIREDNLTDVLNSKVSQFIQNHPQLDQITSARDQLYVYYIYLKHCVINSQLETLYPRGDDAMKFYTEAPGSGIFGNNTYHFSFYRWRVTQDIVTKNQLPVQNGNNLDEFATWWENQVHTA